MHEIGITIEVYMHMLLCFITISTPMIVHAKAKQNNGVSANAYSHLSMFHRLEPFMDRLQKKNNNAKTNIVCLERAIHLCRRQTKYAASPE